MHGGKGIAFLTDPSEVTSPSRGGGLLGAIAQHCFLGRHRRRGLAHLLEAFHYAGDLHRDVWDFAVELDSLEAAGVSRSGLRWMLCKGYVEHAREIAPLEDALRCFRRGPRLRFSPRSCFVLTPLGVEFVRSLLTGPKVGSAASLCQCGENGRGCLRQLSDTPRWDRDRQELRLGAVVVKQFKVPAVNQEKVLAAFEEEGWPVHVDDPLSPQADQDPKRRLHDTINSLNRSQKQPLIRFYGDGSGQGLCWERILPGEDGRPVRRFPR